MDFCQENSLQNNIFENINPKHKPLMQAMKDINDKIGQNKIKLVI